MNATQFPYCSYVLDPEEETICGEQDPELYRGMIYVCDQHRWALESEARRVAKRHFKWLDRELNETKLVDLRRQRMEQKRHIYYMAAGPYVKIGISQDPEGRMGLIQSRRTWVVMPEDIDLNDLHLLATEPGGLTLERQRQQEFKADHVAGEWFRRTPRMDAWVEAVLSRETDREAS